MIYFCTYFDENYLSRAMAMYDSLLSHCSDFHIFMLCFDGKSADYLLSLDLKKATIITENKFEEGDHDLVETKSDRSRLEYYYTCGPSLPLYVLRNNPEIDLITYLDADLFFYSNPTPLINEMDKHSISITVHNFPEYRTPPTTGKYNVGWISFRRDAEGIRCLKWWREKCIDWCYERFEGGKYADQRYLDEWPDTFHGVKVLNHKGANVAAWNIGDYRVCEENGKIMISGYPLIFYHFHGFKRVASCVYNTNLGLTFKIPSKLIKNGIIKPYIKKLEQYSLDSNPTGSIRKKHLRARWVQFIRTVVRNVNGIIFRQYVVFYKDNIY